MWRGRFFSDFEGLVFAGERFFSIFASKKGLRAALTNQNQSYVITNFIPVVLE